LRRALYPSQIRVMGHGAFDKVMHLVGFSPQSCDRILSFHVDMLHGLPERGYPQSYHEQGPLLPAERSIRALRACPPAAALDPAGRRPARRRNRPTPHSPADVITRLAPSRMIVTSFTPSGKATSLGRWTACE
jgi:hypothetical protein